MGYWIDMEHPYITCENDYIESVWWALDRYFKEGLIYQGFKIQLYCPRCGTPLSSHEVSLGYRDVQDPSVYIKAKVKGEENTYFLVWTTTPWTLISNVALAVNPDVEYVKVRYKDEFLILAKDRLVRDARRSRRSSQTMRGRDLVGKEYERWFSFFPVDKKAWYVIGGDFVTTTDGTGIVHMAPAYGEDDYQASLKHDLPMIQALDARGQFIDACRPVRRQVLQGRRSGNHGGSEVARPAFQEGNLHAQLSALLALRHSAALLRAQVLVHPHDGLRAGHDRVTTSRSTGIRRKPAKAASETGSKKTRTGRSRAIAIGVRRFRSGFARSATRSDRSAASKNCDAKARSCRSRWIFTNRTSMT